MKILALDAGLGYFSAALDVDGSIGVDRSDRHDALETGLARIGRLLTEARLDLRALDRIAVGVGPGSFTGLRIALSFAKALAYGAGLPLVGISAYDTLMPIDAARPGLTIVSGRPGVICARLVAAEGAPQFACGPVATVLERLLDGYRPGTTLTIVANTEDALPAIGERGLIVHRLVSPATLNPAAVIATLARTRVPSPSPHALAPDYGELPAVTLPKARSVSQR